jgi:hypothetical protein
MRERAHAVMNIKDIENRIVELRLRERALIEDRRKARTPLMYNAEKHAAVNKLIEDLYVRGLGLSIADIDRYSQPVAYNGRLDEEHLCEINVVISARGARGACGGACSDIVLGVRLVTGFEDPAVREREKNIMDELESIRYTIEQLAAEKRALKSAST